MGRIQTIQGGVRLMSLTNRIAVAWDVFKSGIDPNRLRSGSSYSPDMSSIYVQSTVDSFASVAFSRIASDASAVDFNHVKIDAETDKETIMSSQLADLLGLDTNIDQTFKEFIRDFVKSLFNMGTAVIVPIDVRGKLTLRVGYVTQWYPDAVELNVYNEYSGNREPLRVYKEDCSIIQNPLYAVANGPNTTLNRLITKMNQIDQIDAILSSGKLDLILQLPYSLANEEFEKQAKERLVSLQNQLSTTGVAAAYIATNEKITQLNRPVSDTLLPQVEKLAEEFHNQLGLTRNVLNGTASEEEMRNYYSRTIDIILTAITEGMTKAFLTKTARTQGQKVAYYRNPFALVPMSQLPDLLDKAGRGAYISPNEGRRFLGLKPSSDPDADKLKNRQMPDEKQGLAPDPDNAKIIKMDANTDGRKMDEESQV